MAVVERGEGIRVALLVEEGDKVLVREEQILSRPVRHDSILREPGCAGSQRSSLSPLVLRSREAIPGRFTHTEEGTEFAVERTLER